MDIAAHAPRPISFCPSGGCKPPEAVRIAASRAMHFRRIAALPTGRVLARAASRRLVATVVLRDERRLLLSIIPVDTGVETTVELPDALRIESVGSFAARVDDDGIEVVAIGLAGGVPGGLARWSPAGGWTKPVPFPDAARKALPSTVKVSRVADHWLVTANDAVDHYAWWVIDGRGAHATPPIDPGGYGGATQLLGSTVEFAGGALVFIGDGSSADGQHAGLPGRTRAVIAVGDRKTELAAPFPWRTMSPVVRVASGAQAAIVEDLDGTGARLWRVAGDGVVGPLAVPDGLPTTVRWIDDTLVGWGAELSATSRDGHPLVMRELSGWLVGPDAAVRRFAAPSEAPVGWAPWHAARFGDELCAWGGMATPWDDAAHHTFEELLAMMKQVLGAMCIDPRSGTTRLLTAEPPTTLHFGQANCTVLADGADALLACTDPEVAGAIWIATVD